MNRNHLIGFTVAAAALGLLVFFAWFFFELYPATKPVLPSREARVNQYLALDRWLTGMGCPVRTKSSGDLSVISGAKERRIFIQASLFRWTDEAVEYLVRWVEEGGRLIVAFDYHEIPFNSYPSAGNHRDDDETSLSLLEAFGIKAEDGAGLKDNSDSADNLSGESPDYDHAISFDVSEDEDALCLKDLSGLTRLVQVKRGKGQLIVMGNPRFLVSSCIGNAPNSRLAWALFAANFAANSSANVTPNVVPNGAANATPEFIRDNKTVNFSGEGWFFIRGTTKVRSLLGSIFRHGNLAALLVSVLVLIIVCFWAVLPMFGLVRRDDERPGKPLRERFLAEGRFLKRYGALKFYRDTYVREIRRRLARNEGLSINNEMTDDDTINDKIMDDGIILDDSVIWHLSDVLIKAGEKRDNALLVRALRGEPFTYREFPKMIGILKTILERI